jgi:mycothiol synthase
MGTSTDRAAWPAATPKTAAAATSTPDPGQGGLVLRPFRGSADFAAMAEVANASFAADGLQFTPRTVDSLERDYASLTLCEPLHDVIVAERGDQMLAYARCFRYVQTDGLVLHAQLCFVPGRWRGQGVGRILQAWQEQRGRAVAALQPASHSALHPQHHVYVQQSELARHALLQASGYRPERHFLDMRHTRLHEAPDFALPAGLELRPVLPAHYPAIWAAHHAAFADHWGMGPPQAGDYAQWLASKVVFQPARWQIAWDGQEVAGQVRTYINQDENRQFARRRGYTEFISVGRRWRNRGLARALIARSLRLLADEGMEEAALGVDSANLTGAHRVYGDCGFEVVQRNVVYRKGLDIA